MIAYCVLTAILNLMVGFMLGCWFGLEWSRSPTFKRSCHTNTRCGKGANVMLRRASATTTPVTPPLDHTVPNARQPTKANDQDTADVDQQPENEMGKKSWSDFDQQLESIKRLIRKARAAKDEQLAKDACTTLAEFVTAWTTEVQQYVHRSTTERAVDPTNKERLEFWLAQFETTPTNLKLLNFTQGVDAALNRLEQEVTALTRPK